MRKCLVLFSVLLFSLGGYANNNNTITISENSKTDFFEPVHVYMEPVQAYGLNRLSGSRSNGLNRSGGANGTFGAMKDIWNQTCAPGIALSGMDPDEIFGAASRLASGETGIEQELWKFGLDTLGEELKKPSFMDDWDDLLDLCDGLDAIKNAFEKLPSGLNVYKPNIYLYSDRDIEFSVEFVHPDLLLVTDPYYENGWNIELAGDQLIVDGSEDHRFLFYESGCDIGWLRRDGGFIVNAENRAEQFREILVEYGFNDVEIYDFIEYWDEKLDSKTYVMYPQQTEIVDKLMPLKINEMTFDNRTRLWFAFEEYDGKSIDEPVIEHVLHDKTSLVEWGGVVIP